MTGLGFLDLVIGLIFIYLIFSIACSTFWEIIISFSNLRGRMLSKWITDTFGKGENDLGKRIEDHQLISGLTKKNGLKPSYISSSVFTDVLLDLINFDGHESATLSFNSEILRSKIIASDLLKGKDDLKRILLQYLSDTNGKIDQFKIKIARWYDEAQERLIGSYKKKLQLWIFIISIVLVGATNTDTFTICSYLYNNDTARQAIANKASLFVQDTSVVRLVSAIDTMKISASAKLSQDESVKKISRNFETLKNLDKELRKADLPIGWKDVKLENFWDYIKKIGGLLITALAVSMGSPFWFDLLGKLVNLRAAGNKPKSVLDEKKVKKEKNS
ncbi:MAG TPA: hypothetical protein VMT63_10620 [Bacteroidales bacterium]|nr:hypothetical protein [Bacteroidales bacterium]